MTRAERTKYVVPAIGKGFESLKKAGHEARRAAARWPGRRITIQTASGESVTAFIQDKSGLRRIIPASDARSNPDRKPSTHLTAVEAWSDARRRFTEAAKSAHWWPAQIQAAIKAAQRERAPTEALLTKLAQII